MNRLHLDVGMKIFYLAILILFYLSCLERIDLGHSADTDAGPPEDAISPADVIPAEDVSPDADAGTPDVGKGCTTDSLGRCPCQSNQDCANTTVGPQCNNGYCGCTSTADCSVNGMSCFHNPETSLDECLFDFPEGSGTCPYHYVCHTDYQTLDSCLVDGIKCQFDSDCDCASWVSDSYPRCVYGVCAVDILGQACQQNEDCQREPPSYGYFCEAQICLPLISCLRDEDCSAHGVDVYGYSLCGGGTCVTDIRGQACQFDADCNLGFYDRGYHCALDQTCILSTHLTYCQGDSDCEAIYQCIDNLCQKENYCFTLADCPFGYYCCGAQCTKNPC